MISLSGKVVSMSHFGNKEILKKGRVSRFGTIFFQVINPYCLDDPIGQLYSDRLLDFRSPLFRVNLGEDVLFVERLSSRSQIRSIFSDQIHFVRDIARCRVTAGGWLARVDDRGRILPYERRDLSLVRKAIRGIKPPNCSERDFLKVNEHLVGRIMYVLEMDHPLFPFYRVFDFKGNPVSFWQFYPLSYSQWAAKEEKEVSKT
jgi:hypothetical protein